MAHSGWHLRSMALQLAREDIVRSFTRQGLSIRKLCRLMCRAALAC
jgi:hypothetical protein